MFLLLKPLVESSAESDASLTARAPPSAPPRAQAAPITQSKQAEQESFFCDLFKTGWGSNEKESKQKDPRSTVNLVGQEAGESCDVTVTVMRHVVEICV